MNPIVKRPVVNAKEHKRLRRSVREKCAQIGIPEVSNYREIKHGMRTFYRTSAITQTNPMGAVQVQMVQRVLGNCVRNEIKSMKSHGRGLFPKAAAA